MLNPLFTQEDVAHFLHCSEATVRRLVDRKALGCHFINRARRFTQSHLDEYLKHVANRPPKKRPTLPPIESLQEVWKKLVLMVRRDRPLISLFLEEGSLMEIDPKSRTATLALPANKPQVIACFQKEETRCFLQRCLSEILSRPMRVAVISAENLTPAWIPAAKSEGPTD